MWRGLWTIWTAAWTVALLGIGVSPQSAMDNVSGWLQIMGLESWSAYMAPPPPSPPGAGGATERTLAAPRERAQPAQEEAKSAAPPSPAPSGAVTPSGMGTAAVERERRAAEQERAAVEEEAVTAAAQAEAEARPDFWRLDSYLVLFLSALAAFVIGAVMLITSARKRRHALRGLL